MLSKNQNKRPNIATIKNHLTYWKTFTVSSSSAIPSSSTYSILDALHALFSRINMRISQQEEVIKEEVIMVPMYIHHKIEKNPRQKMKKDHKMLQ